MIKKPRGQLEGEEISDRRDEGGADLLQDEEIRRGERGSLGRESEVECAERREKKMRWKREKSRDCARS